MKIIKNLHSFIPKLDPAVLSRALGKSFLNFGNGLVTTWVLIWASEKKKSFFLISISSIKL